MKSHFNPLSAALLHASRDRSVAPLWHFGGTLFLQSVAGENCEKSMFWLVVATPRHFSFYK